MTKTARSRSLDAPVRHGIVTASRSERKVTMNNFKDGIRHPGRGREILRTDRVAPTQPDKLARSLI